VIKHVYLCALLTLVVSACVMRPEQHDTLVVESQQNIIGGSPFPGVPGRVLAWNGSAYSQIGSFQVESEIRPDIASVYGDFYFFYKEQDIPSWAVINNVIKLKVQIKNPSGNNWLNAYTFEQESRIACMSGRPNPLTADDYEECAYSDDGILTLCQHDSFWTGSGCRYSPLPY
jgi:hypothetical protein